MNYFWIIVSLGLIFAKGIESLLLNTPKNVTVRNGKSLRINSQQNFETCTTTTDKKGLCMKRFECTRQKGVVSGFCGTFGVCCELNLQCSGTSKLKKTLIRNPDKLPRRCTYNIQPYSNQVCQLRVDFDIELGQPIIPDDSNSRLSAVTCTLDQFQIGDMNICGVNKKQHIYIPFDTANGINDVSLSFLLADRKQNPSLPSGNWDLLITQLECPPKHTARKISSLLRFTPQNTLSDLKSLIKSPNSGDIELLAPPGCLQYFNEREGTFESFNFNNGIGPYFGNLRYGICFKRTAEDRGVQFSATSFEIGAHTDTSGFLNTDCHNDLQDPDVSNDYLEIPESVLDTSPHPFYGTFYCGTSLQGNELLHAPPGPFGIYFISDNMYSATFPESGFQINYQILP